jgi:hypothetical protein
MPLKKSKSAKAFEHNLKAEIHAGKPQKQAIAIAYSVKRKAKKAEGGEVKYDPNKGSPFTIYNRRTGESVGKANTIKGARQSRDRNDNEYGGYAHHIKDSEGNPRMKVGGVVSTHMPNSKLKDCW